MFHCLLPSLFLMEIHLSFLSFFYFWCFRFEKKYLTRIIICLDSSWLSFLKFVEFIGYYWIYWICGFHQIWGVWVIIYSFFVSFQGTLTRQLKFFSMDHLVSVHFLFVSGLNEFYCTYLSLRIFYPLLLNLFWSSSTEFYDVRWCVLMSKVAIVDDFSVFSFSIHYLMFSTNPSAFWQQLF